MCDGIGLDQDVVLRRFAGQVANPTTTGMLPDMVMLAGQGVGLVNDIVPAAQVIRRYVEGACHIIKVLEETYIPNSANACDLSTTRNESRGARWTWIEKLCL